MNSDIERLQTAVTQQLPEVAEVIVWLQGDRFDRAEKVLQLWQEKFAPLIIITGNNVLIGTGPRPGETNCSLPEMYEWLREHGVPEESISIDDTAFNTREQAEYTLTTAYKNKWQKIILVGSTHHQLRPFLTFLKYAQEIGWKGKIINQPAYCGWDQIPSGRNKIAREIFADEVQKIITYHQHVLPVHEGCLIFGI